MNEQHNLHMHQSVYTYKIRDRKETCRLLSSFPASAYKNVVIPEAGGPGKNVNLESEQGSMNVNLHKPWQQI